MTDKELEDFLESKLTETRSLDATCEAAAELVLTGKTSTAQVVRCIRNIAASSPMQSCEDLDD